MTTWKVTKINDVGQFLKPQIIEADDPPVDGYTVECKEIENSELYHVLIKRIEELELFIRDEVACPERVDEYDHAHGLDPCGECICCLLHGSTSVQSAILNLN